MIEFTIEEPEYNQETYQGRFMSFVKVCNPLIAFNTNSRIIAMQKMIEDQRGKERENRERGGNGRLALTKEQISELRSAQTVISTAVHPDTGEFIPWPMRMSSFIPMNMPIAFGLIIAAPTPFNTIFW